MCWNYSLIRTKLHPFGSVSNVRMYHVARWRGKFFNKACRLQKKKVKDLVKSSVDFAIKDMDKPAKSVGQTISKIK
ncbi:MAG: hypothetical protein ACXWWA_15525, partial [Chitinophagaceae bacterium]